VGGTKGTWELEESRHYITPNVIGPGGHQVETHRQQMGRHWNQMGIGIKTSELSLVSIKWGRLSEAYRLEVVS